MDPETHSTHRAPGPNLRLATGAVLGLAAVLGAYAPAAASPASTSREACIAEWEQRPAYRAFLERDAVRALALAEAAWAASQEEDAPLRAAFAAADTAAALALAGRIDEALPWYDTAQERIEDVGKLGNTLGRLHAARAVALYVVRRTEEADRQIGRALKRLGKDDWDVGFARLFWHTWWNWDFIAALDDFRQPFNRALELGGTRRTTALMLQSWLEGYGGGARARLYEMAMKDFREAGDRASEALIHRNLGVIALRARDFAAAEAELTTALTMARELGDARLEFVVLNDLSVALSQTEQADRAIDADQRAEALLEELIAGVRAGEVQDDLLLDLSYLMGLRYHSMPNMLFDPFPLLLEQLALRPEDDKRICRP